MTLWNPGIERVSAKLTTTADGDESGDTAAVGCVQTASPIKVDIIAHLNIDVLLVEHEV